ncbi:amino acid adenylation domain-containing protein [Micromonospora sp. DR5-3]|uniref:amino acid adenylation domain-containing protein n=1 Tax=unclassified Micromonospora TaxID=2617518 RepID=UPI001652AD09|nr:MULTISPECIES: amino acid adenylation domain-containing protein [unclassified Micromonospora]MCW3815808.1 amino acid adenylation domain-containing protein [Micromonospora sp. DR5-3]
MTVVETFVRSADRHPDNIAVSSSGESLSYSKLNERANRLAHHLLDRGLTAGTPVGLCVRRGIDMIVALLGVLKAGGACVPLDPQYPTERLIYMIKDTQATLLITHADFDIRFNELPIGRVLLDAHGDQLAAYPSTNLTVTPEPSHLAYVLYTSGSSGEPKGVEIEHGALRDNATKTAQLLGLTADDALLQFASLSFASAMGQIFAPLAVGARMEVRGRQYSATDLLAYIRNSGVTVLWLTPSVINHLTQRPEISTRVLTAPLRLLRSGGEALTKTLVQRWFEQTSVPLLNVYGPTEAVQDITACLLTEPPPVVTIGAPIFDCKVFVLDESGVPADHGVAGELYFSTPGMARGYLNQPALTEERFVTRVLGGQELRLYRTGDMARMLANGELEYLGRQDNQVKVHGHRAELGEVEERLMSHPAVHAAAVVLGGDRLVAYYVSSGVDEPDALGLMNWCAKTLPPVMVPTRYLRVDALPLTINGKLDRRALDDLSPRR